jgi:diadenosine tetraphosphate (Ap4A) HIT family hydrolase
VAQELYNIDSARFEKQRKRMEELAAKGLCFLCSEQTVSISENSIEYSNSMWHVKKNDFPNDGAVLQLLIFTKDHLNSPTQLTSEGWVMLGDAVNWVVSNYGIPGGTFFMRFGDGKYNSSTIAHLHAHIIVGIAQNENDPEQEGLKIRVGTKRK